MIRYIVLFAISRFAVDRGDCILVLNLKDIEVFFDDQNVKASFISVFEPRCL